MPGIRTMEVGYDKLTKTYATEERVQAEVRKITAAMTGICNARVVPVVTTDPKTRAQIVRYTALLCCFSEEGDIFLLARAGIGFLVFR